MPSQRQLVDDQREPRPADPAKLVKSASLHEPARALIPYINGTNQRERHWILPGVISHRLDSFTRQPPAPKRWIESDAELAAAPADGAQFERSR